MPLLTAALAKKNSDVRNVTKFFSSFFMRFSFGDGQEPSRMHLMLHLTMTFPMWKNRYDCKKNVRKMERISFFIDAEYFAACIFCVHISGLYSLTISIENRTLTKRRQNDRNKNHIELKVKTERNIFSNQKKKHAHTHRERRTRKIKNFKVLEKSE